MATHIVTHQLQSSIEVTSCAYGCTERFHAFFAGDLVQKLFRGSDYS